MALQAAVAVAGLVPVGAGLAGALMGPAMLDEPISSIATDSHFRYLSGLLLAIGLGFWSTIPQLPRRTARVRLLTAVVVVGGLGRLYGVTQQGWPETPMVLALVMELLVTPLLCFWQAAISTNR
jgi:hypothetical protein